MSKPYSSGELPMVGDTVDLGDGQGPRARVMVVVGGPSAAAADGYQISQWEYLKSGILVEADGMGLVFEENPDDETLLIARHA